MEYFNKLKREIVDICSRLGIQGIYETIETNESGIVSNYKLELDISNDPNLINLKEHKEIKEILNNQYNRCEVDLVMYDEYGDPETVEILKDEDEVAYEYGNKYYIYATATYNKKLELTSQKVTFEKANRIYEPSTSDKQKLRKVLDKFEEYYGVKIDYEVVDNYTIEDLAKMIKVFGSKYASEFKPIVNKSQYYVESVHLNMDENTDELLIEYSGYNLNRNSVNAIPFKNCDMTVSYIVEEKLNRYKFNSEFTKLNKTTLNNGGFSIKSIVYRHIKDAVMWGKLGNNDSFPLTIRLGRGIIDHSFADGEYRYFFNSNEELIIIIKNELIYDLDMFINKINEIILKVTLTSNVNTTKEIENQEDEYKIGSIEHVDVKDQLNFGWSEGD